MGRDFTYQSADVTFALPLDAMHLILMCLVRSAQVRGFGLVCLHAVAECLFRLFARSLQLQDLLLQPLALAIKGPARLLARVGQQCSLDFVCGAIAQHIQRGLQPLQLTFLDLGGPGCLLLVLPDERLAQRLQFLRLLLVQLGLEFRDVGRVATLLLLALQLGLLQTLPQLPYLQPERWPGLRSDPSRIASAPYSSCLHPLVPLQATPTAQPTTPTPFPSPFPQYFLIFLWRQKP